MAKISNEWEFQGQAVTWINAYLLAHSIELDKATQESPHPSSKRSDITVWRDHAAQVAVLSAELKVPTTGIGQAEFNQDAIEKARSKKSPFVAVWNMRSLRLYRTPPYPRVAFLPDDLLLEFEPDPDITSAEDWIKPAIQARLKARCDRLMVVLNDVLTKGTAEGTVVEATLFVDYLREGVRRLRLQIEADVIGSLGKSRALRSKVEKWSKEQGLKYLVADLNAAIAGQIAYRIVGQALFYLAYRRHEPTLPELDVDDGKPLPPQLRSLWDAIRVYDFEALYAPSVLEEIELDPQTESSLVGLLQDLAQYDWDSIRDDVLGSVFEHLIPPEERIALGQYYTRPELADLIAALAVDGDSDKVLDPALGTGTFLLRIHDRCERAGNLSSADILDDLWGVDISAFAAELAVINLCRKNLANPVNFPKVAVRDFFDLSATDTLSFPPAKQALGQPARVDVPLPRFDVVIGNPPYVRSQQLDDLDVAYKRKLTKAATSAGLKDAAKLDLFAYFIAHARQFLKPGGRLAFVTSAAWLTSNYGQALKRYILQDFQPVLLLFSRAEPFFPNVEVDTVVIILEAVARNSGHTLEAFRFVSLTKPLQSLLPQTNTPDYWTRVDAFAAELENAPEGKHANYEVTLMDADVEMQALRDRPKELRNWARPFRSTPVYRRIFEGA